MAQPVSVIGSQFMAPYPFDLIVDLNSGGNLVITDMNHKVLLKVKSCDTAFHLGRILLHADGTPIVRVREKILSEHNRWKVFKGDSTSSSDLLFSTKQPSIIQFKTSVHVFLANKTNGKNDCDFMIKGSWSKKNCTIHMGDSHSSTIIAEMRKMQTSKKANFDKDKFVVTISPNVDYAFVITLIAIVDAMKNLDKEYAAQIIGEGASAGVGAVAGAAC